MADLQASVGLPGGGGADMLIPNAMSKRQRRPSVRLNEIGDQSADSYLRRNKQWKTLEDKQWKASHEEAKGPNVLVPHHNNHHQQQQYLTGSSKSTVDIALATKLSKTRPLGNIGNGVNNNGFQGPMQVIHEETTQNQNICGPSDGHLQLIEYSGGQISGRNVQVKSRNMPRKVRQGKGRRGGSRGACVVGKFGARAIRVSAEEAEENEKGSGEDGFAEPLSNASYEVETPEGLRDLDLDTSDSPGDTKETSALHVDSPENGAFNLGISESHHQVVGNVYGNERDGFRDQGKSVETWSVTVHNTKEHHHTLSSEYMDGNGLEMPSDTEARCKQDAHEFLTREQKHEPEKESLAGNTKHRPPSQDGGVRAWLSELGLGRYAQLFEMHEVDNEVLPLLTLDDLKDMGINAVGSRRKMYDAIQKLQKNFTV